MKKTTEKAYQQKKLNNQQKCIDQRARALLRKIMVGSRTRNESIWQCLPDWEIQREYRVRQLYMAIARKALLDGFPLEDYYLSEQPLWNIAIFISKDDTDFRELTFELKQGEYYATPAETVVLSGSGGTLACLIYVETCVQALTIGDYREIPKTLYETLYPR